MFQKSEQLLSPIHGAEEVVNSGVGAVVVDSCFISHMLQERAVKYNVERGVFFVTTLAYDVEWLEVWFEAMCVFGCEGVSNSQL
jgi:hypothetical protein